MLSAAADARDRLLDPQRRPAQALRERLAARLRLLDPGTSPASASTAYFQRGAVSAAFRLIPQEIPTLETLGAAAGAARVHPQAARLRPRHRPDRLGQVDHAGGDDRRDQPRAREDHILTIEDPIEFLHQPQEAASSTSARSAPTRRASRSALQAALRQDPDVILVGEMRDLETISTALTAAETGHLVFATLHTQSTRRRRSTASSTSSRPSSSSRCGPSSRSRCRAIVTQQLLPTADGAGRVVACEVLVPTPAVRNLIREGKTHQIYSAIQTGGAHGMQTMDAALARARARRQDHPRARRAAGPRCPEELRPPARRRRAGRTARRRRRDRPRRRRDRG